jgi:WD40 repeat-containing protein SMU1
MPELDAFVAAIRTGSWDQLFKILSQHYVLKQDLIDIYEQIVREMTEIGQKDLARSLLWNSDVMQHLRQVDQDRFRQLDKLLSSTRSSDPKYIYEGRTKQDIRNEIADRTSRQFEYAPSGQLLKLLSRAVQDDLEQLHSSLTLFQPGRLSKAKQVADTEKVPNREYSMIKFGPKNTANCALFSPNGQYFVTGSSDGFIEVWDYETGKLRADLQYQAEEDLMFMAEPVLSLAFSDNSQLLASGSQSGQIKIWNVGTGKCTRAIDRAHLQSITCLTFQQEDDKPVALLTPLTYCRRCFLEMTISD